MAQRNEGVAEVELCQSQQPYRGPEPNPQEEEMLNILQNQALEEDSELINSTPVPFNDRLLEVLPGKNMILAWPKDYTAHVPTKWRFLAELDVCTEWLKEWTGREAEASAEALAAGYALLLLCNRCTMYSRRHLSNRANVVR